MYSIVISDWENSFNNLSYFLINNLSSEEYLTLELEGENSHFIRFNNAKVRQTGVVIDCNVKLRLVHHKKTNSAAFPLTGNQELDLKNALENLTYLREEIEQIPEDPYVILPENKGSSREVYEGELLPLDSAVSEILPIVQDLDFTGYYTSGSVVRANYNSLGQKHWFSNDSFFLDYSLINSKNPKNVGAAKRLIVVII